MKLKYWIADCITDRKSSIRARTKKACQAQLDSYSGMNFYGEHLRKVTIEYTDAFDLMIQAINRSGLDEFDYEF